MPKLFRKKGGGTGDTDLHDDMTLVSGFSMGGSSVSDRIMGRMKLNLGSSPFGSSRDVVNANSSASSVGSGRSKSTGRFGGGGGGGRRFSSSAPSRKDLFSIDDDSDSISMGSRSFDRRSKSTTRMGSFRRSQSERKFKSSTTGGGAVVSSVGVPSMEEMDSSEAMALKGQSFGRRSRPNSLRRISSGGGGSTNKNLGGGGPTSDTVVEYSLAELRSMSAIELEQVMLKAGVSSEDISKTINDATKETMNANGGISEDQKKNLLVTLFVNSGFVKLVTTASKSDSNRSLATSVGGGGEQQRRTSTTTSSSITLSSSINTKSSPLFDPDASAMTLDTTTGGSKEEGGGDKMSKKSKLDKIAELKTQTHIMKRENKSLKKTVKKLLGQLTDAVKEKGELQKKLDEAEKKAEEALQQQKLEEAAKQGEAETADVQPKEAVDELSAKSPLRSIDEKTDKTNTPNTPPPSDVIMRKASDAGRRTSDFDESTCSVNEGKSEIDISSRQSISSEKASTTIKYLKRKLKKAGLAHENTEFRLQAEIDILSKEVEGLQRELGTSLESLDSTKKRASILKHELRSATTKVNELTAEAEARDKLIETFSKILLQRVGLEGGGGEEKQDIMPGLDEVKMI